MITLVGLALLGLALIGFASDALADDRAPQDESGTLDALLFLLCLIGILAAKRKRDADPDDE